MLFFEKQKIDMMSTLLFYSKIETIWQKGKQGALILKAAQWKNTVSTNLFWFCTYNQEEEILTRIFVSVAH